MSVDYTKASFWHDKPEAWKEIMPGVKRRMLAHSLTGLMVLYKIEAGKTFVWHNHPHAQFGIILEGAGKFRVGDSTRDVRSGDTYFIPPAIFHELKTEKECVIVDFFTPEREDYVKEALAPDTA
ncbi:MAG: cupin domain-containing protein [Thaumarchaeota archaeon]|nr:cupin domain-containing protein [Nitrososphaerota archaeon]